MDHRKWHVIQVSNGNNMFETLIVPPTSTGHRAYFHVAKLPDQLILKCCLKTIFDIINDRVVSGVLLLLLPLSMTNSVPPTDHHSWYHLDNTHLLNGSFNRVYRIYPMRVSSWTSIGYKRGCNVQITSHISWNIDKTAYRQMHRNADCISEWWHINSRDSPNFPKHEEP